ncbi:MAG: ribbon-helix-helix protein, CopG family [Tepidiformaceae bacterium]
MKTAVSLPDDLFAQITCLADTRGESRSSLIAQAVREFLRKIDGAEITRQINETYDAEMETEDRAFTSALKDSAGSTPVGDAV